MKYVIKLNLDITMKLGYTIIYVSDVRETVKFYEVAFDLKCRFIHESGLYAEMETGQTVLAFSGNEGAEMNDLAIVPNRKETLPAGWEICFITDDVNAAFAQAIQNNATAVSTPEQKPWGQIVSYVRDLNGCLVEISSPVMGRLD